MPNTVEKFRANHLYKIDKENNNADIKRKLKLAQREKLTVQKTENVWERLSRVKKSNSNEGNLGAASRRKPIANLNNQQRRLLIKRDSETELKSPPLSPDNRKVLTEKCLKKFKIQKTILVPDEEPESIVFLCQPRKSLKQIYTEKNTLNQHALVEKNSTDKELLLFKSSSHTFHDKEYLRKFIKDMQEFEMPKLSEKRSKESERMEIANDPLEHLEMTPLLSGHSSEYLRTSIIIISNLKSLLEKQQQTMQPEQMKIIEDIIKTDQRHMFLKMHDEELFKNILCTQLEEIVKQESTLKTILNKTDCNNNNVCENAIPILETERSPQVDVIFQNVPTLEKEILILKALGDKLESTLNRSISKPNLKATTAPIKFQKQSITHYIMGFEHNAVIKTYSQGLLQRFEYVKEFRIARRSMDQLQKNSSQQFYISLNEPDKDICFLRTCYSQLKENPSILKRTIAWKNSRIPFNVMNQDPFFIKLLNRATLKNDILTLTKEEVLGEGGHSMASIHVPYTDSEEKEPLELNEITANILTYISSESTEAEVASEEAGEDLKSSTTTTTIISTTAATTTSATTTAATTTSATTTAISFHEKSHKFLASLFEIKYPKISNNNLFKIILVGSIQILIFFVLVLAFTYPDIKC